MEYLILVFIFFLGAVLGSFVNVLVIRTHNDEEWVTSRSKCPHCNKELSYLELIPILSYIIQLGKCRHCKKTISFQYPLVELTVGSALTLAALQYGISIQFLNISIIIICLIGIMLSDLRYKELPMFLVYLMVIPGIFLFYFDANIFTKFAGVILGVFFYGLQYYLTKGKGIGDGDIYLGGVLGFVLGLKGMILNLVLTYISALIFLAPLLIIGKLNRKSQVPLGAFMCFAAIVSLLLPDINVYIWTNVFMYIPL